MLSGHDIPGLIDRFRIACERGNAEAITDIAAELLRDLVERTEPGNIALAMSIPDGDDFEAVPYLKPKRLRQSAEGPASGVV